MFERFNPPPKPKAPEKKPAAIPKPVPVKAQEVEHVEQTDQSVLELRVALHQSLIEKINLNALEKLSREDVADQVRPLVVKLLLDASREADVHDVWEMGSQQAGDRRAQLRGNDPALVF